jgi:hypothetical protein
MHCLLPWLAPAAQPRNLGRNPVGILQVPQGTESDESRPSRGRGDRVLECAASPSAGAAALSMDVARRGSQSGATFHRIHGRVTA